MHLGLYRTGRPLRSTNIAPLRHFDPKPSVGGSTRARVYSGGRCWDYKDQWEVDPYLWDEEATGHLKKIAFSQETRLSA